MLVGRLELVNTLFKAFANYSSYIISLDLVAPAPRESDGFPSITCLWRALPGILLRMTIDKALDVTRIYSVADQLPPETPLIRHRPFRAPHHTISHAGLVGGGNWPHPGEISLAHRGVLFLDEFPEFGMRVLEVLRQPIEDKVVTISRAQGSLTFPTNFMMVAAMNPCPCGYYGDPVKPCTCSSMVVTKYQKRISGRCSTALTFTWRCRALITGD